LDESEILTERTFFDRMPRTPVPSRRHDRATIRRHEGMTKSWSGAVASARPRCGRSAHHRGTSQMRKRSLCGMPVPTPSGAV